MGDVRVRPLVAAASARCCGTQGLGARARYRSKRRLARSLNRSTPATSGTSGCRKWDPTLFAVPLPLIPSATSRSSTRCCRGIEDDILPTCRRAGHRRDRVRRVVAGSDQRRPHRLPDRCERLSSARTAWFQGDNFVANRHLVDALTVIASTKAVSVARLAFAWVLARWRRHRPAGGHETARPVSPIRSQPSTSNSTRTILR